MAADEKYPVPNRDNLMRGIQIQLSQKQKSFSEFIVEFLKFRLNFEHFEKKDDSHSFCVSEIRDCENVVRWMSKKCCFRGQFDKQHGKRAQALLKSLSQNLYHLHWSLATKFCSKMSLLLICEILGLLVNTLAADEKYPLFKKDNLKIPIQMHLF